MDLHIGETEAALTMLADIRHRHDGTLRSPWNEVECGDHYVRPMASWTLLEEAMGYRYDAVGSSLRFAPKFNAEEFTASFVVGSGWGLYQQDTERVQITVDYGDLTLSELILQTDRTWTEVLRDGEPVNANVMVADGSVYVSFAPSVTLVTGETLTIKFGG